MSDRRQERLTHRFWRGYAKATADVVAFAWEKRCDDLDWKTLALELGRGTHIGAAKRVKGESE